ncbi:hypothetical protein W97_01207 [Coniosporium apollinis CBS 100218]|uniref:Hypervirulence associated protein TUDOR domain-containing protein n=1 Tax=Coniosporium apollinis (strain CBS 100218) TaxID=1168221 RepID=R7YJJ9_CONA1|nr:uncharacterized protein W97_01207 [Coniosporium apollinis CBS 100218]EON61989.1 hypothetical protein W97_01207 [Coniosporium apollinis CBS 100218]
MPPKGKYTKPKLREEVKEEIHASSKGGAPGQWSARKAQMMASEYKKRGGGYTTDKKDQDESQKHLSKWTEEEWQTKEGSAHAKQEDGTRKRYLPKKAWEEMSEGEKKETDEKKVEGSKEGRQHVGNTERARRSRRKANDEEDERVGERKGKEKKGRSTGKKGKQQGDDESQGEEVAEGEEHSDGSEAEYAEDGDAAESEKDEGNDGEDETKEEEETAKAGQKRGRGRPSKSSSNKKQKGDSGKAKQNGKAGAKKNSEPPAKPGSKDRLPKKGQKVHWHSLPGYIEGEVVEIAFEDKEVEGKRIRGKKDDPRIVMKSSSSGKIASHKPEAVFFD